MVFDNVNHNSGCHVKEVPLSLCEFVARSCFLPQSKAPLKLNVGVNGAHPRLLFVDEDPFSTGLRWTNGPDMARGP